MKIKQTKTKQRNRSRLKPAVAILLVVVLGAFVFFIQDQKKEDTELTSKETPLPTDVELTVLCVGDIMMHKPQLAAQYDSNKDKYKCDNNYKYVKSYIKAADLALCNVETTFAGKPYTGYPRFCAPDALARTLKRTGFDVAITSNNHMVDKGLNGVKRTLRVLKKNDLATVGSVLDKSEPRYTIQEIKGVKIGIIAYTYETGSGSGPTSINGEMISDEAADHINSFNPNTLDADLKKIKKTVKAARKDGAEVIIAYYHWGEEYQKTANRGQKKLAEKTAQMDVDMIFASHPHVLQEVECIHNKKSGKKVPVYYSMGNFISNQRSEVMKNRYTEQGLMAKVDFTYSKQDGSIKAMTMGGIPTWVDKYSLHGKTTYEIIPLDDKLEKNKALAVSGHMDRAKQALEDSNEILGLDKQQN